MYKYCLKNIIDFLFASILLFVLFPILLIVTLVLSISNKGTPFFIQKRPGLNGKPFPIIKFKTLNDNVDRNGQLLPDSERLTKIGKIVRATSLDEIPQLFNVLFGHMSLVGPRPLLLEYLSLYNDFQKKRHLVKPGITGLSQINGRNEVSWEQRFETDVWYCENLSFLLDFKIIFKTIFKVFKKDGVTPKDSLFMPKFKGNKIN